MDRIAVIAGPTAVGKTEISIMVAQALDAEIVSCDSMQLYKYMDIGSAKPTADELSKVRHHLVDMIDPGDEFSVASYQRLAKEAIKDIFSRGKLPLIVGGTGLYLNSLLYDMDFSERPADGKYRRSLYEKAEKEGPDVLHDMLKELDPAAAEEIHPHNVKRIVRALERIEQGEGRVRPFKGINEETGDYEAVLTGLTRDRKELYERIDMRVDILMQKGLLDEVRRLSEMGLTKDDISMKGIGYKELMEYLEGGTDLDEAVDNIRKNTRHYAKKQLTWFRRYDKMKWYDISGFRDEKEAAGEIALWLKERI